MVERVVCAGEVDGWLEATDTAEQTIVEIKLRLRQIQAHPPASDLLQLQTYLHINSAAAAYYVQGLYGSEELRVQRVLRDDHLWEHTILPGLRAFVCDVRKLLRGCPEDIPLRESVLLACDRTPMHARAMPPQPSILSSTQAPKPKLAMAGEVVLSSATDPKHSAARTTLLPQQSVSQAIRAIAPQPKVAPAKRHTLATAMSAAEAAPVPSASTMLAILAEQAANNAMLPAPDQSNLTLPVAAACPPPPSTSNVPRAKLARKRRSADVIFEPEPVILASIMTAIAPPPRPTQAVSTRNSTSLPPSTARKNVVVMAQPPPPAPLRKYNTRSTTKSTGAKRAATASFLRSRIILDDDECV